MRATLAFIPRPVRVVAFLLAVAVILYLSLAPNEDVPGSELIWDKAAHSIAYTILVIVGLLFSTHRRWAVVLAVWSIGIGIEFAQAVMPFGRQGDWRDALANSIGIAAGVTLWALARRFKPKPPPET
jgi:VanZ family protein